MKQGVQGLKGNREYKSSMKKGRKGKMKFAFALLIASALSVRFHSVATATNVARTARNFPKLNSGKARRILESTAGVPGETTRQGTVFKPLGFKHNVKSAKPLKGKSKIPFKKHGIKNPNLIERAPLRTFKGAPSISKHLRITNPPTRPNPNARVHNSLLESQRRAARRARQSNRVRRNRSFP